MHKRCFIRSVELLAILIALVLHGGSSYGQDNGPVFEKLDQELQARYADQFSFSVIIADEKKILFSNHYGYADSFKTEKVNGNTLFQIASVNKTITAIGIFKLIEEKKLNLSDSIGKFFSPVSQEKQPITIAHLLAHQSGFQQNYVCTGIKKSGEAIRALLQDTLAFVPGTGFSYSNQNYELLALVIEAVTGVTYEDYIRKNLLNPLEMKNTFFWEEVKGMKNIAYINTEITDSLRDKNWDYTGSGGIYSTASDLFTFFNAVVSGRILSPGTLNRMFTEQYRTASGISICYGWFKNGTTEWGSSEIWTRGSESWGHNAVIRWFPGKKRMIIVCTNSGELDDKQRTGNRLISDDILNFLRK